MNAPIRILIVEDSENDALLLIRHLQVDYSDLLYKRVETAQAMRDALDEPWDLVISDYVLPQFSGLAALGVLHRSGKDLPFIVVSGQIGEDTAVSAMKAGAHDYIMKDNLARLRPAVKRELNEAQVRQQRRDAEQALRRSEAYHRELAEQRQVLLNELDHRVRNNLASLLSLVSMMEQSAANPRTFAHGLTARLEGMIVGYDLLAESGWEAVELADIVRRLCDRLVPAPKRDTGITHQGPSVKVSARQAGPVAMVLQELLSNSIRHGAISSGQGKVDLTWGRGSTEAPPGTVRIVWDESGGPSSRPPHTTGMGIELVEGFARCELGGRCEFEFRPQGMRCVLDCSLEPNPTRPVLQPSP